MIPTATLFTKTRNRRRHFMQLRSNPDFMHGDFEMFSRVWRSIESLFLTSGLRKHYAREVSIRSVAQYQISPNFLFRGLVKGGRTRKIGHYAKIRYGRGKDIESSTFIHQLSSFYIPDDITRAPRGTDRSPEYNEHFCYKLDSRVKNLTIVWNQKQQHFITHASRSLL